MSYKGKKIIRMLGRLKGSRHVIKIQYSDKSLETVILTKKSGRWAT
ncbi:MAG: hypothetical protein IJ849_12200 [Selenomonadaceae bacterium]|nr:hypothetical protein [Selenomonadaceae bacterium]